MGDRVQEAKEEGIRQGIWLCVQKLVYTERCDMAKYLIESFRFDKNECKEILDKNSMDDKMKLFVQMILDKDDNRKVLKDIEYHKIGSVFKCNIGSKEIELEVVDTAKSYSCNGCVFNNESYCCRDTYCVDADREDNVNVIYKEVKRS
jgi:hypothetical protein